MKKSVYSLVLMDNVIEAIDTLAYSMNTSRSNLINQILAEKVALVTPEMQMQSIFETMERRLHGYSNLQIQSQASDTMMSIRSVLRYKYNPTIRYAINLYRGQGRELGELKVVSRTQSGLLADYLNQFFKVWGKIEIKSGHTEWMVEQGAKWSRNLMLEENKTYQAEEIAEAIATYIKVLDDGLKIFFGNIEHPNIMLEELNKHYNNYQQQRKLKI